MLVYLDNCCYNRPYDDQSYVGVWLESQAKLYIQELIKCGKLEMVNSYMLEFENSQNPFEMRKSSISKFISENEYIYVSIQKESEVNEIVKEIMKTGIKYKDACHVACAMIAGCKYFITTDHRLLKYRSEKLCLINPTEFVRLPEVIEL